MFAFPSTRGAAIRSLCRSSRKFNAPGDQLPTAKQFASDLVVNPSTVARAMRAGRGSFVAAHAARMVATNAAKGPCRVRYPRWQ